jgi:hypothetical protein
MRVRIAQSVQRLATDWMTEGGQTESPGWVKNFLFSALSKPALRPTQPPIQWVLGPLSLGVKLPVHEADHTPPTSADIKKRGSKHPLPHTPSWHST